MANDSFDPWLGHIGKDQSLRASLRRAAAKAGKSPVRAASAGNGGRQRFTGARSGRGAVVGSLLARPGRHAGERARRAIVKARFVRLAGKGMDGAAAHLRYLERDGTTREGERGQLYGPETDIADGRAFLEKSAGDRHQFRLIVSAEDGLLYQDLKPLTRQFMAQVERDLETRLDWVAVDHFNTVHPHTHIILRGIDDRGKDLVIARSYMSYGLQARAADQVNRDLGARSEHEVQIANEREVSAERFTGIDRRLLQARDDDGRACAWHPEPQEQALRAGRLQTLERLDLASDEGQGRYALAPDLEATLREMGRRGDIIAAMHRQLQERATVSHPRSPSLPDPRTYAIFDPASDGPVLGRVLAQGRTGEHEDRHSVIVEAIDGRTHHIDLGNETPGALPRGSLVEVVAVPRGARDVDRTIAEVASRNDGLYDVARHRAHDPSASLAFAEIHVRRLEAIRRLSGGLERQDDGAWKIGADYIERAGAHERDLADRRPAALRRLSDRPIEQLVRHDGPTWLDERCLADARGGEPEPLRGSFGGAVSSALQQRRQWLVEQDLAVKEGDELRLRAQLLATLRQRELARIGAQLSSETGLAYVGHEGGAVEGIYRRAITVGTERYAVIEKSKEFTLAPWRPVLERQVGREVSGIVRGASVSWRIGRGRDGPEIE